MQSKYVGLSKNHEVGKGGENCIVFIKMPLPQPTDFLTEKKYCQNYYCKPMHYKGAIKIYHLILTLQ